MKNYFYLSISIALLGTLIILLFINNIKESLTPIILFWTFLSILWYSQETHDLKEGSIKRPFLSFNREGKIYLKNYGEGAARDIKIKTGDTTVHKIPLVSSFYSKHSGALDFSEEVNELLEKHKEEILICYYDTSGKVKYTTKIKWDDSPNNRDGCKIIEHKWE